MALSCNDINFCSRKIDNEADREKFLVMPTFTVKSKMEIEQHLKDVSVNGKAYFTLRVGSNGHRLQTKEALKS